MAMTKRYVVRTVDLGGEIEHSIMTGREIADILDYIDESGHDMYEDMKVFDIENGYKALKDPIYVYDEN
jgi:hypothetical protein